MIKTTFILAVYFTIMAAIPGFGQTAKKHTPSFSMGVVAAEPTGDLALVTPFGLGSSIKAIFPVSGNRGFTVSAGYLYLLKKTIFGETTGGFHAITLKAGVRIFANNGFYVEPETGFTFLGMEDGGDVAFTYAGNIGYVINNKIDVSARYEGSIKYGPSVTFLGVRIARSFTL